MSLGSDLSQGQLIPGFRVKKCQVLRLHLLHIVQAFQIGRLGVQFRGSFSSPLLCHIVPIPIFPSHMLGLGNVCEAGIGVGTVAEKREGKDAQMHCWKWVDYSICAVSLTYLS